MLRKSFAEFIGTFWLVFGGCGSALLAAAYPNLGIGFVGVSLAFGLTVLTMAYSVGHISGGHFNPAVTLGVWVAGRCESKYIFPYIMSQLAGGVIAAATLYFILSGHSGFDAVLGGFASNGYGEHSPDHYNLVSVAVTEFTLTCGFLIVILGVTEGHVSGGFAPIAIGLCLTLIHLISIPVSNTSVNPARSTAVAIFQGGWAIEQLWLFWAAPVAGAIMGGLIHRFLKVKS